MKVVRLDNAVPVQANDAELREGGDIQGLQAVVGDLKGLELPKRVR